MAALGLITHDLPHDAGVRINLDIVQAFAPPQILFHFQFKPLLAHKITHGKQRIFFHLLRIGLGHIPENMRKEFPLRVTALCTHHNLKPRPRMNFCLNTGDQLKIDVRDHHNGFIGLDTNTILLIFCPYMGEGNT